VTRHERRIDEIGNLEEEINTKINAEELNELQMFEEMKKQRDDN
jgi:hypothetical protein